MAGESDNKIDRAQRDIANDRNNSEGESLKKQIEDNQIAFFFLVDSYQNLAKDLNIQDPTLLKYWEDQKTWISDSLKNVAADGKWINEHKGVLKVGSEDLATRKEKFDDINIIGKNLKTSLDKEIKRIRETVAIVAQQEKAKADVDAFEKLEKNPDTKSEYLAAVANKVLFDAFCGLIVLDKFINEAVVAKTDSIGDPLRLFLTYTLVQVPKFRTKLSELTMKSAIEKEYAGKVKLVKGELVLTPEGEKMTKEEAAVMLVKLGSIKHNIEFKVLLTSAPKALEPYYKGIAAFEAGDLEMAKKLLEPFSKLKQDEIPVSTFENGEPKILAQSKINEATKALAAIETITKNNGKFFEAQKLINAGRVVEAKALLKEYLKQLEEKKKEGGAKQPNFSETAKELLKKIALFQLQQLVEEFKKIPVPENTMLKGGLLPATSKTAPGKDPYKTNRYYQWQMCKGFLEDMKKSIEGGVYDFSELFEKNPFKPDFTLIEFNELDDVMTIEKEGRPGYLKLARTYREKGDYSKARQYFMMYFGNQIETDAKDHFTLGQFKQEFVKDPKRYLAVTKEISDKINEQNAALKLNGHPPLTEALKINIHQHALDEALAGAYPKALLRYQNGRYIKAPAVMGSADDQKVWNDEFMNMEGMHKQAKGGTTEMFAMSDEEVNSLVATIAVNVPLLFVSAGTAGAAAGIVRAGVMTAGRTAATELAAEAGYIAYSRTALAYTAGLMVENGVFTGSNMLFNSVRSGDFSAFNMKAFEGEWHEGLVTFGGLGAVGMVGQELKIAAELGKGASLGKKIAYGAAKTFNAASSLSMELSFMGAQQGKVDLETIATVLGLKLGHGFNKLKGKAEINDSPALLDSHYFSEFGGKTPKELGDPAKVKGWIDTDGKVHYGIDYFEKQYGVKMTQHKGENVFIVDGKPLTPKEFFKTEKGKNVLEEMKKVKDHEVTHRLLELFEKNTKGKLGENLKKFFTDHPELAKKIGASGKDFRSIQELLCQVADGSIPLAPAEKALLEAHLSQSLGVKGFNFDGVRKIDTKEIFGDKSKVKLEDLQRIYVASSTEGVVEEIKRKAELEHESGAESEYSILDQISGLEPDIMLLALKKMRQINSLNGTKPDLKPIIDPETGAPMESSKIVKYLLEQSMHLTIQKIADVIAGESVGKEVEITDESVKSFLRKKAVFIIETVFRTKVELTTESELPAEIRKNFKEGQSFIVKLRNKTTGKESYKLIDHLDPTYNVFCEAALPGGSKQYAESFGLIEPKQSAQKTAGKELSYAERLLEAGREINARKDLNSEEKAAKIRVKVSEIRAEIAARTGALAGVISKYLDLIPKKLKEDPSYSTEKILSDIDKDSDLVKKFTPVEIANIKEQVAKFFAKSQIINTYYLKFKDKPQILFEMQFGFKPTGKVELIKQNYSLTFQVFANVDKIKIGETLGVGEANMADVGGHSFAASRIPDLSGYVTTIYGERPLSKLTEINTHEERHNINRAIFAGLRGEEKTKTPEKITNGPQAEHFMNDQLTKFFIQGIERAKDEILAYIKGGTSEDRTYIFLTTGDTYDYWAESYRGKLLSAFEECRAFLPADYMTTHLEPAIHEYTKKHFERVKVAVGLGYALGPARLNEMAITPMFQWPNLREKGGGNPYLEAIPYSVDEKSRTVDAAKYEAYMKGAGINESEFLEKITKGFAEVVETNQKKEVLSLIPPNVTDVVSFMKIKAAYLQEVANKNKMSLQIEWRMDGGKVMISITPVFRFKV